jgi:hypothetical protein
MRLVLAVTDEVNRRADANMERARRCAAAYRKFGKLAREVLEDANEHPAWNCDIEALAALRHECARLLEVLPGFMERFRDFRREHEILIESDLAGTLEAFASWVEKLPDLTAAPWKNTVDMLDADIAEQAAEVAETAADWSEVDGDGLGPATAP